MPNTQTPPKKDLAILLSEINSLYIIVVGTCFCTERRLAVAFGFSLDDSRLK